MSTTNVTELRVKLMSRARLSKTYLVVSDQSKGDLERSSRDQARQCFASRPQDFQWSTTRTEQGSCLLTIPVLVEGDSFGPAKQYLPGQVTFKKLTLRQTRLYGNWNSTPSGLWKHETIGRQGLRVLSPIADQGGADYQRENKVNWC